jgi:hypothetical protein
MDASFLAGPRADFPAQPRMFCNEEYFLSNGCTARERRFNAKQNEPVVSLARRWGGRILLRSFQPPEGLRTQRGPHCGVNFRVRIESGFAKTAVCEENGMENKWFPPRASYGPF